MAAGHPLTDEDRWPWLDTIAAWIDERVAAGEPAVVTCSALKKIYRDKLRRQGVVFVYMQGTFDEVMERLSHRQGHFMKPSMLQSQSDILEEPGDDEIHCFASMFVRQVRQCFSVVWADGFPRCRHRFPVM